MHMCCVCVCCVLLYVCLGCATVDEQLIAQFAFITLAVSLQYTSYTHTHTHKCALLASARFPDCNEIYYYIFHSYDNSIHIIYSNHYIYTPPPKRVFIFCHFMLFVVGLVSIERFVIAKHDNVGASAVCSTIWWASPLFLYSQYSPYDCVVYKTIYVLYVFTLYLSWLDILDMRVRRRAVLQYTLYDRFEFHSSF